MRIETERLIIRSFRESDIEAYATIVRDPRVTKYLNISEPHSYQESSEYISRILVEEKVSGIVRYAVELKDEGELIGFCGFKKIGESVDFGWRYGFDYWGRGFGTEAAIAVLDYGIGELNLTDIFSCAMVENIASVKIIRKLGYRKHKYHEVDGKRIVRYFDLKSVNKSIDSGHPIA